MANQIKQTNIIDNSKRAVIKYVYLSDGTNQANTIILDAATLARSLNANSQILGSGTDRRSKYDYTIKEIYGIARLGGYIKLGFQEDGNTDIVVISSGQFKFGEEAWGDALQIQSTAANATGNLVMTIVGAAANDSMTLFIDITKNPQDYDVGVLRDPVAFNQ